MNTYVYEGIYTCYDTQRICFFKKGYTPNIFDFKDILKLIKSRNLSPVKSYSLERTLLHWLYLILKNLSFHIFSFSLFTEKMKTCLCAIAHYCASRFYALAHYSYKKTLSYIPTNTIKKFF